MNNNSKCQRLLRHSVWRYVSFISLRCLWDLLRFFGVMWRDIVNRIIACRDWLTLTCSLTSLPKNLPTRPAPKVQKVKDCRHNEKRAHGVCLHRGAMLTFVSEFSKLESRSLTGAIKRGRIGCREDRRVTRIHNTGRGLARCDPVLLTHLYRRINMQGEAEAQQQMAANPPWWLKEGWNPGISSLTPGVAQISDRLYSHKPPPPIPVYTKPTNKESVCYCIKWIGCFCSISNSVITL